MKIISSHQAIKMRVLIFSAAVLACATAAPSGALVTPYSAVVPAVVPALAVNSGDLQAALIDAKVQTEDYLRAAADGNREATEQAIENNNEKVVEVNDLVKERSLEAFWAGEEKKWQALDAVQTAQAQLDGQLASTSDAAAKSLVQPAIAVNPIVAPVSPYYLSSLVLPGLKTLSPAPLVAFNAKAPMTEEKKDELVKSAEKPEEAKSDSVQVESAEVKAAEPKEESKYVVAPAPLIAPVPYSSLNLVSPWISSPAFVQPILRTGFPYPGQFIAPTIYKAGW